MAVNQKVFIISIDGATWSVLRPFMDLGFLPCLKSLIEDSFVSPLKSVIPPCTAPAWVSFMTGKKPGKHGIYDFRNFDPIKQKGYITNATHNKSQTIWEIISAAGKKVVALNLPYTYPPAKVNGIMISGFDIPSIKSNYVYPPAVKEEILKRWPKYAPSMPICESRFIKYIKKYLDCTKESIRLRTEVALYLQKEKEWDVFMVHFQEIDFIQHLFWDKIAQIIEGSDGNSSGQIISLFQYLDSCLKELLISTKTYNASVFVLSDHGFGEHRGTFCPNLLLKEWGYLDIKDTKNHKTESLVSGFGKVIGRFISKVNINNIKDIKIKSKLWLELLGHQESMDELNINWDTTKVLTAIGDTCGIIFINKEIVSKEEYSEISEDIKLKFKQARDMKTGELLFKDVLTGREAFDGSDDDVPDVVLIPKEGFSIATNTCGDNVIIETDYPGLHREEGILVINGHGVKRSQFSFTPKLIDLAPTILCLLGIEIPGDMDGKFIKEAFENLPDIRISNRSSQRNKGQYIYTNTEEKVIKEHLKSLGYLQ